MIRFVIKVCLFFLPFIVILGSVILLDPFKVWFEYEDYYKEEVISTNRENVCLKLFEKGYTKYKFNSFILGSSRSQAFKTREWSKYLDSTSRPFHFDASGEGIYGIKNKLEYLDRIGNQIDNVLIIVDENTLITNYNRKGHLFISPPTLSGESNIEFHKSFFKTCLNPKFIYAYIDYKLTKKEKPYMGFLFNNMNCTVNYNGDVFYNRYDYSIRSDSLSYYKDLTSKGVFYQRKNERKDIYSMISEIEEHQLKVIYRILKKHNTKYKIVVSPLYDQRPLNIERVNLLNKLFGKENVFDFSGSNQYTESVGNFYESSHYRPHVANEIMKIVYN